MWLEYDGQNGPKSKKKLSRNRGNEVIEVENKRWSGYLLFFWLCMSFISSTSLEVEHVLTRCHWWVSQRRWRRSWIVIRHRRRVFIFVVIIWVRRCPWVGVRIWLLNNADDRHRELIIFWGCGRCRFTKIWAVSLILVLQIHHLWSWFQIWLIFLDEVRGDWRFDAVIIQRAGRVWLGGWAVDIVDNLWKSRSFLAFSFRQYLRRYR